MLTEGNKLKSDGTSAVKRILYFKPFHRRGVTKNITLRGERKKNTNNKMVFSAESLIDRQDFEISWNRPFQKIAGMMVSNEVKILLNIKVKEI